MKVIKWMLLGAVFANLVDHPRHRRHRQPRLPRAHRRPHPGRHRRIQPVRGVHHPVHPGHDRGRGRVSAASSGSPGSAVRLVSCMALAMTASRGGIVGVVLACAIGAYLYRQLISYSRVAGWVFGIAGAAGARPEFLAVRRPADRARLRPDIQHRRHRGILRPQRDLGRPVRHHGAAADHLHHRFRLERLLVVAVPLLAAQPLLLAVVQPRPGRPAHRLLPAVLARSRARAAPASWPSRRYAASSSRSCIGGIAVCGAVFFVELHDPWIYFWMYTGVVMRLVLCVAPASRAGAGAWCRTTRSVRAAA